MRKRTLAESSELLRIALPLMAKYTIPVTPPNYAVWYEYAAGDNQPLKERIDRIMDSEGDIDEGVTEGIQKSYLDISGVTERSEKAQESLRSISDGLEKTLTNACGEANVYEESLESYQGKISTDLSGDQLSDLINNLSDSTKSMQDRNMDLINDLEETRRETDVLREELKKAKQEAQTDALTAMPNRAAFISFFDKLFEAGEFTTGEHCVVFADIDHFKKINDTYGHIFGDQVIRGVAKILKDNTKGKDFAARFGGEEFIILLPDTAVEGAKSVAENIRKTLESARIKRPGTGKVIDRITLSLGISSLIVDEPLEKSIEQADEALYRAKNGGRNQVVVFSE